MKLRWRALALCVVAFAAQAQTDTARPEIGEPLLAAQDLIKARKFKEALVKLRDAEAVTDKTDYEWYTLEHTRLSAAIGAKDMNGAARAFEALDAMGRLSDADRLQMLQAIASGYYRAKEYAHAVAWTQRYLGAGGTNPQMRKLLAQSQYLSGDVAGAVRELRAEVLANEKANTAPAEDRLVLLLTASARRNDDGNYTFALERLLAYYPKKVYWAEMLDRVQRKPGFSNRYALDVYRLMLASASMRSADDYMAMAQLALQAGLAAEARAVLEQGYATQVLGAGEQAGRHRRLRDLARKQSEQERAGAAAQEAQARTTKDGTALVNLGFALALSGQASKGTALIELGIAQGDLARPDEVQLRLGQALVLAGQYAKAVSVLNSVTGKDGATDLARLWILLSQRQN